MANDEHLAFLKQGTEAWNHWRAENPTAKPDLSETDLLGANLREANLTEARLRSVVVRDADLRFVILKDADLRKANLRGANLYGADLTAADLRGAILTDANLHRANLTDADLREAILYRTNLTEADLHGAILREARLWNTVIADVDLTKTKGLDTCRHDGPSTVDHRTLERSRDVPSNFWRGCGLPDNLIAYLPSLPNQAIQFYSCFISYSSKDQKFADRLHADLQNKGVRCWFAPHDLPIGAKTWDGIDQAIRTRDKVLLILSDNAIASDWVEDEVTKALAEERRRNELVLFPIRLDDAVMDTTEPWAGKLRDNRNIGDFRSWKDHDAYQKAFERVLRDLKTCREAPNLR